MDRDPARVAADWWRKLNAPSDEPPSWRALPWALLRALPGVAASYLVAVYVAEVRLPDNATPPTALMANIVLPSLVVVMTATHGLMAGGIYAFFMRAVRRTQEAGHKVPFIFHFVLNGHLAMFFGIPILMWTAAAGPWTLLPLGVQLLVGPLGTRRWSFVSHASTSLALVLFVVFTKTFAPWGITVAVVAAQVVVLALIDLVVRPAMVTKALAAAPATGKPAAAK